MLVSLVAPLSWRPLQCGKAPQLITGRVSHAATIMCAPPADEAELTSVQSEFEAAATKAKGVWLTPSAFEGVVVKAKRTLSVAHQVSRSKAEVACEVAKAFPHDKITITAKHGNIKDEEFSLSFFEGFVVKRLCILQN